MENAVPEYGHEPLKPDIAWRVANSDLVRLTFTLGGAAGTQMLYIAVRQ